MPLFLGPGFRLGARWNRLVETVKTRKKREKTEKKWARYGLKRVKESGSPGSPRGFRSLWPAAAEAVGGADGGVRPGRDAVCGGPCGRRARQLESLAGAAAGHARRLVSRSQPRALARLRAHTGFWRRVVGCGWLCKWEIFPNMGWFMCTVYVTWATSKVLANCERFAQAPRLISPPCPPPASVLTCAAVGPQTP